ncbi:MAG: hypothetical protein H0U05_06805 [Actinobacteria bacterium]|nr:hypothetical protein [Actinomycetota bacterium]
MRTLLLVVALLTAVVFTWLPAAEPAATRIVDRTLVCKPVAYGGVSDVDLMAGPTLTTRFGTRSAHLIARTGTTLPNEDLVFVRARAQARLGTTSPFPGPAGVYAHARRCAPSRAMVQLSSTGLPGPPARFADDRTCSIRGRIVVRVRARLATPAAWRRSYEPFLVGASGRVEEASLVVRGASNNTLLAYMTVDRTGKTKFWLSTRCV